VLFKSQVLAQASGSNAGLTYSHNRGGNYTRMRKTPVNPNTTRQQVVRNALSYGVGLWTNTLSAVQRSSWDTYAFNTPLTGPLGDPRNVGGLGMFLRQLIAATQAGITASSVGPTIWDTGTPPVVVTVTYDQSAGTASVVFVPTETWYTAGASLLLYQGRPQNATRNFFKGPFRFLGAIQTPDTSPQLFGPPLPYTVTAGQAVFTRARALYTDGRLSSELTVRSIVVA
jgi:hypothetical protein